MKNKETRDTVAHTARTKLGWRDRLRVLCGREIATTVWIDIDVVASATGWRHSTYVERIRPAGKMKGGVLVATDRNK